MNVRVGVTSHLTHCESNAAGTHGWDFITFGKTIHLIRIRLEATVAS